MIWVRAALFVLLGALTVYALRGALALSANVGYLTYVGYHLAWVLGSLACLGAAFGKPSEFRTAIVPGFFCAACALIVATACWWYRLPSELTVWSLPILLPVFWKALFWVRHRSGAT